MEIPKTFKIMGYEYSVVYDDKILRLEDLQGQHNPRTLQLLLHPPDEILKKQQVEHNFFHELVHAILTAMGEEEINANEQFVDVFAGLLYQALKTSKGNMDGEG
jgi:hypothetical protein